MPLALFTMLMHNSLMAGAQEGYLLSLKQTPLKDQKVPRVGAQQLRSPLLIRGDL